MSIRPLRWWYTLYATPPQKTCFAFVFVLTSSLEEYNCHRVVIIVTCTSRNRQFWAGLISLSFPRINLIFSSMIFLTSHFCLYVFVKVVMLLMEKMKNNTCNKGLGKWRTCRLATKLGHCIFLSFSAPFLPLSQDNNKNIIAVKSYLS